MPTAATRPTVPARVPAPTLHLALDLGNTTWKLALATSIAHAPRLRTVPARDLARRYDDGHMYAVDVPNVGKLTVPSLREEIRQLQRRLGITTVFVTHDQEEALSISDRIVVMYGGKAEQVGTPFEGIEIERNLPPSWRAAVEATRR